MRRPADLYRSSYNVRGREATLAEAAEAIGATLYDTHNRTAAGEVIRHLVDPRH